MKWCIFLSSLFVFSNVFSQNHTHKNDRWLALLEYAQIKESHVRAVAPHFPPINIQNDKQYEIFKNKLEKWKKNHPSEVEAFLSIPEIKKLNPSRVHLGLEVASEKRKFENSYWQWITAAGLSISDVREFAPHFPQPRITEDLEQSEKVYEAALSDWMRIFPEELEALLNEPRLAKLNKHYMPVKIDAAIIDKFVLIPVSEKFPEQKDFDSGNAELDAVRYDLAVKHWYFKYKPQEYAEKYAPKAHHKDLEQKQ
ncbi:MAG: hypothetical protein RMJ53_01685 [Chitinophagales bacterium]|nr:hypothetical protein [Chitinophagales bacterium]